MTLDEAREAVRAAELWEHHAQELAVALEEHIAHNDDGPMTLKVRLRLVTALAEAVQAVSAATEARWVLHEIESAALAAEIAELDREIEAKTQQAAAAQLAVALQSGAGKA